MIELFRDRDQATIGHLQGILESNGIATFLRNENVFSMALPMAEFVPALCILDAVDEDRARDIVRDYASPTTTSDSADLICPECGESCPANYSDCWNCGMALVVG